MEGIASSWFLFDSQVVFGASPAGASGSAGFRINRQAVKGLVVGVWRVCGVGCGGSEFVVYRACS